MSFFEVSEDQIRQLNDLQLTELVDRLLELDAAEAGIPKSAIETTLNIKAPDGGLDARVAWTGDPARSEFIPRAPCGFQIKATEIGPTACGTELVKLGKVKPLLDTLFTSDGIYVLANNRPLNTEMIVDRISKMRSALANAGAAYAHSAAIEIYGANRLKMWTNKYIAAISFVQSITGATRVNGLRPWKEWEAIVDTTGKYFLDDLTKNMLQTIRGTLSMPRNALRLRGLSGLGKTRAALEAFRPNDSDSVSAKTVYYDAANDRNIDLKNAVIEWCRQNKGGIVVVDNCPSELHTDLQREVEVKGSRLSVLTLSSSPEEKLRNATELTLLKCDETFMATVVKELAPSLQSQETSKIVELSSGFVFFAKLLCEAWNSGASLETVLPDRDWLIRMLGGSDQDTAAYRSVQSCALFDSVDLGSDGNSVEAKYASAIADVTPAQLYAAIKLFEKRGIVEVHGSYIRVRPHPLALKLCASWWDSCSPHRAQEIFEAVPESMVDSLCERMRMLSFLPEARALVAKLSSPTHPFGQAEMLKSARGARIFRALVEINPEAVMASLLRAITSQNRTELKGLKSARRDWVWTLERLVFLREQYDSAAKALAILAVSENESYSNNATGTLLQTFHIRLPGTQASLAARSSALAYLFKCAVDDATSSLALDAASHALETERFTRTIGAEDQGLGPPLEEYEPKSAEEIMDYWRTAIGLLVEAGESGTLTKGKILEILAPHLRGFVRAGCDELAKAVIEVAVRWEVRPWLEGLDSLGDVVRFEGKHLSDSRKEIIGGWLSMISPSMDDHDARLAAIVSRPSWTAFADEDQSGKMVNTAEGAALALAGEVIVSPSAWLPHIASLLAGEQRLAFAFGKRLGSELQNPQPFLQAMVAKLSSLPLNEANLGVLVGMLVGMQDEKSASMHEFAAQFLSNDRLKKFSPAIFASIRANPEELMSVLSLAKNKAIESTSLKQFAYGRALDHLAPGQIVSFCYELARIIDSGAWMALEIIYMYCLGDSTGEKWSGTKSAVRSLHIEGRLSLLAEDGKRDLHIWEETASKLLKDHDEALARVLSTQLVEFFEDGARSFDVPDAIVRDLLTSYGAVVWPIFAQAIISKGGVTAYRLSNFLGISARSRQEIEKGPIDALDPQILIASIQEHPKFAAVAASMISPIIADGENLAASPLAEYLIETFGDDDTVLGQLTSSLFTGTWWGSRIPYYKKVANAFSKYATHQNKNVRRWATSLDEDLLAEIARDQASQDAHSVGRY